MGMDQDSEGFSARRNHCRFLLMKYGGGRFNPPGPRFLSYFIAPQPNKPLQEENNLKSMVVSIIEENIIILSMISYIIEYKSNMEKSISNVLII